MDVSTSQQFIDVYNRISKLETDITNVVKEFYSNLVKSYDEIVDTPENLSDFNNDLDFITKDEVEDRINNISIDDSDYLKKTGEEKQKCTAPTEFEELYTTTQDPEDSSDKVATTKFVHSLVSNNGESVTQQIIGAVGKKYITSKAAESIIKDKIGEHQYGTVVNLVNKKIEDAIKGIEDMIPEVDVPTHTSDLINDSGFITLGDVPGDLVTSVNGQTGNVQITIPQVPTNISSFTNDAGYITDPGVTSVNNRTGNVMVQENVQSDWSATTGLAKILNKPALKSVAVTGDYNDLENTPDLSIYAQAEDLADVAVSGSYTDLTNTPEIPPTMTILSYGKSNWQDFMNAYTTNTVVYCRASSNSNPASGSQTRMAFLAYVNNATNPTEVEFQYYRSVSTHTDSQQGDQVYVYKLNSSNGGKWSVTVREAYTKIIAGTNLTSSYASSTTSGKITLNAPSNISAFTNDVGYLTEHQDLSDYATITDVQTEVASLVDQAPTTLDTLNELATALGNDPNFATTVASQIGAKYTKPSGGIPKSDLSSAVQTSLGKADTALQSHQDISGKVDKVTSTDNAVVRFDGTSGAVQNSGVTIDDSDNITAAKFVTKKGTTSQVVRGDGSLAASKELPQYEAYLEWGGKNFTASYGPIDAAMVSDLGANRLQFLKAAGITIEYSRDNGTTWQEYPADDSKKVALFSTQTDFIIGKGSNGSSSADYQLRVTINSLDGGIYSTLNKFVIFVGTNGSTGCYCTISARTQGNFVNNIDTWKTISDQIPISGWTGYNIINIQGITTCGNTANTSQYRQVRFTFGCTKYQQSATRSGLSIIRIMGFGGVGWMCPSTMAKTGHLYSFDNDKNATFPARITATAFKKTNGTSSQFLKADGSVDSNTYLTEHQSLENYATKNYVEALEQRIAALEAALNNS